MTEPRSPQVIDAERAVLGACMSNPHAYSLAAEHVTDQDFYLGHHQVIWGAITQCVQRNGAADPQLLIDMLRSTGEFRHPIDVPYVHTLLSAALLSSVSVEPHARLVADTAVRRRLVYAGQRLIQRSASGESDVDELVEDGLVQVRAARDERVGVELLTRGIEEFMHGELEEPDWVVPGLLARGDRFVLTGSGGLGKSTVLLQIAVCAAAGLPPFDWFKGEVFAPVRVSWIDSEIADHELKTRLWPLLKEARASGCPVEDRLMVGGHGNPLNLLDASSSMSLLRTIERDKPDLVYVGPVYKLHMDDPDKEVVVKKITTVLDQIRQTGAALITEAHHTKEAKKGGSLEPSGSNLWTWWPEFGRGLRLDADAPLEMRRCALETWRIDRVQRQWPDFIETGGRWPWARSS